jgi:dTDP-glucose pyrophosphorylase
MNLILTMAGKYSRFKSEGYGLPKFLLPWGDRSILSEILGEMAPSFKSVFLIANKADEDYMPHITKIMKAHRVPEENLYLINDTRGQAETACIGVETIGELKGPVVFHNIDTILYNRNYEEVEKSLKNYPGFIDIFKSNNHSYSYVVLDGNKVNKIVEKVLISDVASSGMYGFQSIDIFKKYCSESTEYISDVYSKIIENKLVVVAGGKYSGSDTVVLGTPEEYINLSKLI